MVKQRLLRLTCLGAVTALAAAAPAAAAPAGSLVFIKDHNVWLAAPDGSALTQVTTDGSLESPYRSPSQADDGTIAASHKRELVRLRQNGEVLGRIDPPAGVNSVGQSVDGVPIKVAISPDGTKIAYAQLNYACPVAADCMARGVTAVTWADRFTLASEFATTYFEHPRWVGNSRLVVGGGAGSHMNLVDVAAGSQPVNWVNASTDLGMASVSRDGARVAAIRGYDSDDGRTTKQLIWFDAPADPRTSPLPPAEPTPLCVSNTVYGLADPVFSPSGADLAFALPDGVHVAPELPRSVAACDQLKAGLVIAGASEPDWGPAPVNPGPRTQAGGQGGPGAGAGPGGNGTPGDQPGSGLRVSVPAKLSANSAAKGIRVTVSGATAGRKLQLRLVPSKATAKRVGIKGKQPVAASAKVTVKADGTASAKLTLKKTAAAKLRKAGRGDFTVQIDGATPVAVRVR